MNNEALDRIEDRMRPERIAVSAQMVRTKTPKGVQVCIITEGAMDHVELVVVINAQADNMVQIMD